MKYRLKAPFTFTFGWGQVNSASNRATAPKGTAVIEATNLPDGGYWLAPEKLEVSVKWLEQPVDHRVESLDSWIDCYGIRIPAEEAAEFVESYEECYECCAECSDEFQNAEGEIVCEECAEEEAEYMTAKYAHPEGVKVHETAAKIVSALEDTVEQLDPTAEWSRVQAQVFPLGYTGDETLEDLQGKALSYLISRCGEVHSPADEKALRAECERIMAGVKA